MPLLIKSQRLPAPPSLSPGDRLTCTDHDGQAVEVTVTWPQPPLADGRWVCGTAGQTPVTVWLTW